jgi:TRAP-type mannitol/chloroaromatic compound transport system permease large subunit
VFGQLRGGLALSTLLVGALLAATTGVVAASVISMTLISLPAMQRIGYHPRVACGVITASGTLTQVLPPSIVLIVVAEQLGLSLGDLYAGIVLPAALLIAGYGLWIGVLALLRPTWVPAVEPAAGSRSGHQSLAVLMLLSAGVATGLMEGYPALLAASARYSRPGVDESVIVAIAATLSCTFGFAAVERVLGLRWLSPLARRVAFVLVPPLLLIFAVLGSVFLGMATPTESGAIGAVTAMALAAARKRLGRQNLREALVDTVKLSCVVMMLILSATVFSLVFQALGGTAWVHEQVSHLPGGPTGFVLAVLLLVFVLGMFLDFFEVAVIVLPIVGPIAGHMGIEPVWFAVLLSLGLQAAYLSPPFGFALFYLRGVAPRGEAVDARSGRVLRAVTTADIYRGTLPFIAVQALVVALILVQPDWTLRLLQPPSPMSEATVERLIHEMGQRAAADRGAR